jgi:hypothetical protein
MNMNRSLSLHSRRFALSSLCIATFLVNSGCSLSGQSSGGQQSSWLSQGSLSVSRPIPKSTSLSGYSRSTVEPMLGFMPNKHSLDSVRLRIDTASSSLSFISDGRTGETMKVMHLDKLQPGRYRVMLKQRDPVWYATDTYFSRRRLPIPSAGSTERFRRGAMGRSAIFLDDQTPIFASPAQDSAVNEQLALDGLNGVILTQSTLEDVFQRLNVGDTIEIR